jgi:hypothetical protein
MYVCVRADAQEKSRVKKKRATVEEKTVDKGLQHDIINPD